MATKNKVDLFLCCSAIVSLYPVYLKAFPPALCIVFVNSLLTDCLVFLLPAAHKRVEGQHAL